MTYRERLSAPASYWIIALFFGLTFVTAVGMRFGPWVAVSAAVITTVGIAVALILMSRTVIRVEEDGLHVGDAFLEWPYTGALTIRDRSATRDRLGVDANAAAWVVQRPYIDGSVEVEVQDAADPHPYWLVSTRNPAQLAAAIERVRRDASGPESAA